MTPENPTATPSDDGATDPIDASPQDLGVDEGAAPTDDEATVERSAHDATADHATADPSAGDATADPSADAASDESAGDGHADAAPADAEQADEPAGAEAGGEQAASARPAPRPTPVPRPGPRPGPRPPLSSTPAAAAPRPPRGASARPKRPAEEPWGRVEDDGTVSVREADGWRVVGQYPDGTPDEALAYFERKFADLAAEVRLLEERHAAGAAAGDLKTAAEAVRGRLVDAAAVGDLAGLVRRIDVVDGTLKERTRAESAAAREAVEAAVRARTEVVERIEALAARDPQTLQWKQTTADVQSLFDEWQRQQQDGPRLPKSTSQQLWKRFRDARATLDKARREFYSDLDAVHKTARDAKTRLVDQAEALGPRGEDGIPAYRELLDRWKSSGRAGKKADDALWARFKAAGDALYAARSDRETADAEASKEKIETRRALLAEAKGVAAERDIPKARALLTSVQRRWDDTGRVFPRETERALDDDLRKIEQALRAREDADWKSNDPTQRARANDMTRQLEEAIAKLEDEVAAAKASGDKAAEKRATEALAARRSWLGVVGR